MAKIYFDPFYPDKLFELGAITIARDVAELIPAEDIARAVQRHATGQWKGLTREARTENEWAVKHRGSICSWQTFGPKLKVRIETDPARLTTTITPDYGDEECYD